MGLFGGGGAKLGMTNVVSTVPGAGSEGESGAAGRRNGATFGGALIGAGGEASCMQGDADGGGANDGGNGDGGGVGSSGGGIAGAGRGLRKRGGRRGGGGKRGGVTASHVMASGNATGAPAVVALKVKCSEDAPPAKSSKSTISPLPAR